MSSGTEGKTEKATPKKRRDERKKGNIFQSKDVINVFSLLGIFAVLRLYIPYMFSCLNMMFDKYITSVRYMDTVNELIGMDILRDGCLTLLLLACPVMLVAMLIGVVASGAQTRFNFSKENLKMKFSRLSPIQGFKRFFSMRSAAELFKSLLKIAVIGYVLYTCFKKNRQ